MLPERPPFEITSAVNKLFIVSGSNGLLLRTNPDYHSRLRILFSIVPTTVILPVTAAIFASFMKVPAATSMARENAAATRDQGDNAY